MSSRHIRGNLVYKNYVELTAAGDLVAADLDNTSLILVNKTVGEATAIGLPAAQYVGQAYIVVDAKGDAGTNNITITPASGTINGAATYVISDNYGSVELVWDGTNFTASARAGGSARAVTVTDAATYTVLAADSGKTHVMPNFTSSCTLTLPAAAAGLEYVFIGKAVAADAQNWIFDTADADAFYLGGLSFADTDAGAAADEIHAGVWPNGSTNALMTIVTPGAGTRIHLVCDGTNWIVNGQVFSATVPTFGDT